MNYNSVFFINGRKISFSDPTYFIADIAANHDGDLERAKMLIHLAKEAGADCAKFQHFKASGIVSAEGFEAMGNQLSHQAKWKKSVTEVYDQYHTRREWTSVLVETAREVGIDFMTTPYDIEAIDMFSTIVPAFKVGSGDITFREAVVRMAETGKPVLLATGASDMEDVIAAVEMIVNANPNICLMQCNTNYTGSVENFKYVNLQVLPTFAERWPGMILGFSDHTPGHSAVLGAVTLGARVVEKHFTDDNDREGPDHSFALNPKTWRDMVDSVRELEAALGDGIKRIESNELETVVIQRRALRLTRDIQAGEVLCSNDLEALRPCPEGAITPMDDLKVIGRKILQDKKKGMVLAWTDLG
ncbi:N-acetylneuraminate synthase family protein [Pusillimonas sp. CC-YST705]|uniref:N-acetylneuraminate synthase family protein n=1 Tax=Mesopusillimonas faecipullorum TaxID=2755040 RepID=A0ABS8CAH2_9BURK|nr:N-acetylneuraminate synthase family protein [Mesopusillimonas faecipullorum]MCB5363033.1 N-acetylneuraminate synthase family protein [Mesopusillimonas faecipullorum]